MSQSGIFISGAFPSNPIQTVSGNDATKVGPDGTGNIRILGGTGVTVTNTSANTETINIVGGGINWNVVNANVTPMVANNGYIVTNSGSQSSLQLPVPGTSTIGDIIMILAAGIGIGGVNGGSWILTQTGLVQQTQFATFFTTAGATGKVYSQLQNDFIELVYIGSDIWVGLSVVGNLSFT